MFPKEFLGEDKKKSIKTKSLNLINNKNKSVVIWNWNKLKIEIVELINFW